MQKIKLAGKRIGFFGKQRGSNDNKFNRVIKLAVMYDGLVAKFNGMIERGIDSNTLNARLALAAKMLLTTGVRIGNEESAEGYQTKVHPNNKTKVSSFVHTYGLTTLLPEHLVFRRNRAALQFLGKAQVDNLYEIQDSVTVGQLRTLWAHQNETLFDVTSHQLAKFIKQSVGAQFMPKDFRTLRANIEGWQFVEQICKRAMVTTKKAVNAEVKELATHVSEILCNTPSVCKSAYIDPALIQFLIDKRY